MKYIAIILLIFSFIKTLFYGNFELNEKKNKIAGIGTYFIGILGLIIPLTVMYIWY